MPAAAALTGFYHPVAATGQATGRIFVLPSQKVYRSHTKKRLPPGRLPCKGSCRRQPTEGCGILLCQYPFGLAQCPPPAGVNARPTMQGKRTTEPGTAKSPSAQGPMISSARQRAWRKAGVYALPPTRGRNVGRAFSPAARGLRHRRVFRGDASTAARRRRFGAQSTKCRPLARRSSPTKHRAGFCRGLQDISDAKWQCTPPSPSVTPPLAGEALSNACRLKGSPVRGAGGVSRLRGAVPCPANILPGWPPRRAISPALHCKANGRHNRGRQTVPRRRAAFRTDRPLRPLRRGR